MSGDFEFLVVEDNAGDVKLIEKAFEKAKVSNLLHVAEDGQKALDYLRRQGPYKDANRPSLVMLDINLPKLDGKEVLKEIKGDPKLKQIPVIILTSSESEQDIRDCYELHANSVVTKPVGMGGYMNLVFAIKDYWINMVKLPD